MSEQMNSSMIGRENVYTCGVCGKYTVTVDVDEGVTPFMILCRAKPKPPIPEQRNAIGYARSMIGEIANAQEKLNSLRS